VLVLCFLNVVVLFCLEDYDECLAERRLQEKLPRRAAMTDTQKVML
jgi:hypothetical protein